MKRLLYICVAAMLVMMTSATVHIYAKGNPAGAERRYTARQVHQPTVEGCMRMIHEHFGVNFIYDSGLQDELSKAVPKMPAIGGKTLEQCLDELCDNTVIEYEITSKYIVLTRAGQKKKPKNYTIFIEEQRDTLTESRITAYLSDKNSPAQTGYEYIDASAFRRGFAALSAPDVLKTLQVLPGVSGGTELMNGLYVHGGTGNDNLYLYDGVPLYSVSHLAGLYSAFNTDIVDNVNFYKSAFPASYGGRSGTYEGQAQGRWKKRFSS